MTPATSMCHAGGSGSLLRSRHSSADPLSQRFVLRDVHRPAGGPLQPGTLRPCLLWHLCVTAPGFPAHMPSL